MASPEAAVYLLIVLKGAKERDWRNGEWGVTILGKDFVFLFWISGWLLLCFIFMDLFV